MTEHMRVTKRRSGGRSRLCGVLAVLAAGAAARADVVLYGGAGNPTAEGWAYQAIIPTGGTPPFVPWGGATVSPASPGVRLNTESNALGYAGWQRQLAGGTLNPGTGFRLSITAGINRETHNDPDRAGLALTLVSDAGTAIEFGLWQNQIYALRYDSGTDTYVAGQTAAFDTTSLTTYDIYVAGGVYSLVAGGQTLLTGNLSTFPTTATNPATAAYSVANTLVISDNTSRASVDATITSVTLGAVPEPGTALVAAAMAGGLLRRRR